MNILYFDTETASLPRDYKAPAWDTENWPRMVQLAYRYEVDGVVIAESRMVVSSAGTIDAQAVAVHGIHSDVAALHGVKLSYVLKSFAAYVQKAEKLIAHNYAFDAAVIDCECYRTNRPPVLSKQKSRAVCTMLNSVEFVGLPGKYGKLKWPKLDELHEKLFGVPVPDAHDALADVRAMAKCYVELKKRAVI